MHHPNAAHTRSGNKLSMGVAQRGHDWPASSTMHASNQLLAPAICFGRAVERRCAVVTEVRRDRCVASMISLSNTPSSEDVGSSGTTEALGMMIRLYAGWNLVGTAYLFCLRPSGSIVSATTITTMA